LQIYCYYHYYYVRAFCACFPDSHVAQFPGGQPIPKTCNASRRILLQRFMDPSARIDKNASLPLGSRHTLTRSLSGRFYCCYCTSLHCGAAQLCQHHRRNLASTSMPCSWIGPASSASNSSELDPDRGRALCCAGGCGLSLCQGFVLDSHVSRARPVSAVITPAPRHAARVSFSCLSSQAVSQYRSSCSAR
jgi:hypothetical protein